jgi:hypothetical protein
MGTKLSYCNGEIGPGSSNITLYIVWAYETPPCIAQTLQQMYAFRVERKKRWEHRESRIRVAQGVRECNES